MSLTEPWLQLPPAKAWPTLTAMGLASTPGGCDESTTMVLGWLSMGSMENVMEDSVWNMEYVRYITDVNAS